tara:strand:+ start:1314 stop:1655 length:342 start_codon:yes stop_codon:yes gene_type:complete
MAEDDKTTQTTSPMMDLMNAMQAAGFKTMAGAGNDWMETIAEMGSEMMRFTAERIREDVQARHAILNAKDFTEAQHVQAQFFQKAMDDYRAETAKLVEIGQALNTDKPGPTKT